MVADLELPAEAREELGALPSRERKAVENALTKLHELRGSPGYPHSSQVQGTDLRELRPRRGHSPWRAFYKR